MGRSRAEVSNLRANCNQHILWPRPLIRQFNISVACEFYMNGTLQCTNHGGCVALEADIDWAWCNQIDIVKWMKVTVALPWRVFFHVWLAASFLLGKRHRTIPAPCFHNISKKKFLSCCLARHYMQVCLSIFLKVMRTQQKKRKEGGTIWGHFLFAFPHMIKTTHIPILFFVFVFSMTTVTTITAQRHFALLFCHNFPENTRLLALAIPVLSTT